VVLEWPTHATLQPANSKRNRGAEIRLRFDRMAQRLLEVRCHASRGVRRFSIRCLRRADGLIGDTLGLGPHTSRSFAESLLNLPADIAGRAFYAVFIHGETSCLPVKTAVREKSSIVRPTEQAA
jgi:hypothetical protein